MAVVITIGGVEKQVRAGSLRISQVANGRATASFTLLSTDASYRPAMDAEVLITEDGTRIFGGLAQRPEESGLFTNGALAGIATSLSVVDFNAYADRRAVNGIMPAATMKGHLLVLHNSLAQFGVSVDAGQVDGPALPELVHEYDMLSNVLNEVATLTAAHGEPYAHRIDEFKVLSMKQPSTVAAPFNVTTDTPAQVLGDITVTSTREHYANSIIVLVPSKTEMNRTESFTGDGTTTTFALNYTIDRNYGYVTNGGANELLGTGVTWSYDAVTNAITRSSAPAAGTAIAIPFDGTLATFGLASDAGEIAAVGYWEKVIRVESVPNAAAAQARADAELASALAVHQTVRYRTLEPGVRPGQSQTITVPKRNVDATGMITDVVIRDIGTTRLIREVTVLIDESQTNLHKNWRDVYKKWSSDTTGKGAAVVSGTSPTTPPAQGGPGGPNTAVQWNNNGVFGGEAEFTYNATTNSLVCGALCSITAGAPESCAVFGYDGHIADP